MTESSAEGLRRDIYWQEHVAKYGTTPEQRARAAARAAKLRAKLAEIEG